MNRGKDINILAAIAAWGISIGIWNFTNQNPSALDTITPLQAAHMREDIVTGLAMTSLLAVTMYAIFGKKGTHVALLTAATGAGLAALQSVRIKREIERRAALTYANGSGTPVVYQ